jgi:hypothetical protein
MGNISQQNTLSYSLCTVLTGDEQVTEVNYLQAQKHLVQPRVNTRVSPEAQCYKKGLLYRRTSYVTQDTAGQG